MPTFILPVVIPIILTVVAFILLYAFGKRKFFIGLANDCKTSLRDMDAFLFKKIEESITLSNLVRTRSEEGKALAEEADLLFSDRPFTVSEREALFKSACANAEGIMAFFKAQPELCSLPNYHEYEIKMRGVDATIINIRNSYNESAEVYNKAMHVFPGSHVADKMKLTELDIFGN